MKKKTIFSKIKRVHETVIDTITESKIYRICERIKEKYDDVMYFIVMDLLPDIEVAKKYELQIAIVVSLVSSVLASIVTSLLLLWLE